MVAFRDDTDAIQQQIGPIRSSEELKEAILSGAVASITPDDHWLIAWTHTEGIQALEFMPIDVCKERWSSVSKGYEGKMLTIEVFPPGTLPTLYVMIHPSAEDTQ